MNHLKGDFMVFNSQLFEEYYKCCKPKQRDGRSITYQSYLINIKVSPIFKSPHFHLGVYRIKFKTPGLAYKSLNSTKICSQISCHLTPTHFPPYLTIRHLLQLNRLSHYCLVTWGYSSACTLCMNIPSNRETPTQALKPSPNIISN